MTGGAGSRVLIRSIVVAALALLLGAPITGVGAAPRQAAPFSMSFATATEPLVVAGTRCNEAEGSGGGWVGLAATWWWEGSGRVGPTESLASADFRAQSASAWEQQLPRRPLSVVPSWATAVVFRIEGRCSYGIATSDYEPIELRIEVRGATTATAPGSTPTTPAVLPAGADPSPAVPISSSPSYTG